MLVQKLRLQHGWSQQQLAEASGLSVRTVQRIEAGFPASTESLKSLAAVFEVDFSSLNPEPDMNPNVTASSLSEKQEQEAFQYVGHLRRFYLHLARYALVSLVLLAVNLLFPPHYLWVFWAMGGWGLGILFHASRVFGRNWFLGPEWERQQVEKRLRRPL